MKNAQKMFPVIGIFLLMACNPTSDKSNLTASSSQIVGEEQGMPTFVIEREMPGAGELTNDQLKGASQASCNALKTMGPDIRWLHSYVTENKVYCVYQAKSEDLIKEHAQKAGFPANSISRLATVIDPTTAE